MISEKEVIRLLYDMIMRPENGDEFSIETPCDNFVRDFKDNLQAGMPYTSCDMTSDCGLIEGLNCMKLYGLGTVIDIIPSIKYSEMFASADTVITCRFTLTMKAITLLNFKRL